MIIHLETHKSLNFVFRTEMLRSFLFNEFKIRKRGF